MFELDVPNFHMKYVIYQYIVYISEEEIVIDCEMAWECGLLVRMLWLSGLFWVWEWGLNKYQIVLGKV